MKYLYIFIIFICVNYVMTAPKPQDEEAPPEGGDPPAEGEAPPEGEGEAPPEGEAKPEEGDAAEKKNEESATTADAAENTVPDANGKEPAIAKLLLSEVELVPGNVITDRYGEPVTGHDLINITLENGGQIYTEKYETYYTRPQTIPGCLCITRSPLTKFKLIGNIHFPKIKVTPPRYVTEPTEPSTTLCPPCDCTNCPNK